MGVEPEKFWDMIPSEFRLVVEHRTKAIIEEENRHQRRTALLAAMIANFSGHSRKKYKVEDFMPKQKAIGKDMFNEVQRLNALFGGEIRRK